MNQDAEHLKLLSIFHYLVGGLAALFAFLPVCHLTVGIVMLADIIARPSATDRPPVIFALMFILFPAIFILVGLTYAASLFFTGRFIAKRKHYSFCFVVACIDTLFAPWGTVLGVFTIIALLRPSVKTLFGITDTLGQTSTAN